MGRRGIVGLQKIVQKSHTYPCTYLHYAAILSWQWYYACTQIHATKRQSEISGKFLFCFGATPGVTPDFELLVVLRKSCGIMWDAGNQSWVGCVQGMHPTYWTITLTPGTFFFSQLEDGGMTGMLEDRKAIWCSTMHSKVSYSVCT